MSQEYVDSAEISGGTLTSYLTGFILALILTAIPFALVMSSALSTPATLAVIVSAGFVQILAHLYFFLHLKTSPTARWDLGALIFTIVIMILFVGGSIWILFNLYHRLM
jgi:cytochrome o ubiquinol oxidase subunit IV